MRRSQLYYIITVLAFCSGTGASVQFTSGNMVEYFDWPGMLEATLVWEEIPSRGSVQRDPNLSSESSLTSAFRCSTCTSQKGILGPQAKWCENGFRAFVCAAEVETIADGVCISAVCTAVSHTYVLYVCWVLGQSCLPAGQVGKAVLFWGSVGGFLKL